MRIAGLFRHPPSHWGLRGDPFLWEEMIEKIGHLPLPETEDKFSQLLDRTFEQLIGHPISSTEIPRIERFSHGGMSSGMIAIDFWRTKALPLLRKRFSKANR